MTWMRIGTTPVTGTNTGKRRERGHITTWEGGSYSMAYPKLEENSRGKRHWEERRSESGPK